jgi:hypothetical protein
MAIGSGLGGQLTFVAESTFGTYVSATRGIEITNDTIAYQKNRKESFALRAGGIFTRSTRSAVTTTGANGDINLDVPSRNMGLFFQSLMGPTVTPTAGSNTTLSSGGTVGSTSIVLGATVNPGDVLTIDSAGTAPETRVNLAGSASTTATIAALNSAHTNGVTVLVNGGSSGFVQKHTPGDTLGKSLSIQRGLPKAGGTVVAWTATGCHVDAMELSIKTDDLLKCKMTVDAQNLQTPVQGGPALATASYTTPVDVFSFQSGQVIIDGAMAASVIDYTQKIETKGNLNRYYLNATGLKAEQIRNAEGMADGTLTLDYVDDVIPTKFFNDNTATLVMTFQAGVGEALVVTCPAIRWLTAPVQLPGPQILQYPVTFRCYDPGSTVFGTSAPIQITYVNADSAL